MADNVQMDAGAGGEVAASDDIGGVQYQRIKLTDGTANSATVIEAGNGLAATALRVTLASDSTGVVSVDDNGAALTVDWAGTTPPIGAGTEAAALRVTLATDSTGVVSVDDNGGSLTIDGNVGLSPQTSGGLSIFRSIDLDESEEQAKATAGQVFGWYMHNAAAATLFVKFYNATAASDTVGTTVPVLTVPIPAGASANVEFANGIAFSTAITVAATTAVADNDTGAPGANELIINLFYK